MIVTRSSVTDSVALAAIHAEAFSGSQRWSAASLATLLAQPGVTGVIDEDGGFLLLRVAADEAEILTLAVVPGLRRQGRGRALLREAEAVAVYSGAVRIFLEVAESNAAAAELYRSAGYREAATRRNYYAPGEDAVLLRRDLAWDGFRRDEAAGA